MQRHEHKIGWDQTIFYCGCEWDPRLDLRVDWYKEGIRMAKFNDRIFLEDRAMGPPRLLYIKDLTIQDAGNYSCHAYTKVGNVVSEAWSSNNLIVIGPPEPPAAVRVSGDCRNRKNVMVHWKKGEELGEETRQYFIEFSTNSSSRLNRWFGGEGDELIPDSRISAFPGTQDKWDITKWLVPGASLIFRIRGAGSQLPELLGRPSQPSEIGTCVTKNGSKFIRLLSEKHTLR